MPDPSLDEIDSFLGDSPEPDTSPPEGRKKDAPYLTGEIGFEGPATRLQERLTGKRRKVVIRRPEQSSSGAVEGFMQGATFGFSDELGAALRAASTRPRKGESFTKTYRRERDTLREQTREAKEAEPWKFGISELVGGTVTTLIPGVGAARGLGGVARATKTLGGGEKAVRLARFGGQVGRGATLAGVMGAGKTEAEDIGQQLKDAGKAAAVGGGIAFAVGGLGRLGARSLTKEAEQSVLRGARQQDKAAIVGRKDFKKGLHSFVRDHKDLALKAAEDPAEAATLASEKIAARLEQTRPVYEALDRLGKGVKASDVRRALAGAAKSYPRSMRREFARLADDVVEGFDDVIPTSALRERLTQARKTAFGTGRIVDPAVRSQARMDATGAVADVLDQHLDKSLSSQIPGSGKTVGATLGKNLGKIKEANKDLSRLIGFKNVMDNRVFRQVGRPDPGPGLAVRTLRAIPRGIYRGLGRLEIASEMGGARGVAARGTLFGAEKEAKSIGMDPLLTRARAGTSAVVGAKLSEDNETPAEQRAGSVASTPSLEEIDDFLAQR